MTRPAKDTRLAWGIKGMWNRWHLLGIGYFGNDPAATGSTIATWRTRREAREARRGCYLAQNLRVVRVRIPVEEVE